MGRLVRWRVILLALLCFVGAVLALEWLWREFGFRPSVVDGMERWAVERDRVYDPRAVTLVGDSRMLFNLSRDGLEDVVPGAEMVQLAIGGSQGGAVLRDLARDSEFAGVVVVSLRAEGFEPGQLETQQSYVEHYDREWRLEKWISRRLRTELASRLVILNPAVALRKLADEWLTERELTRPWIVFRADRTIDADFSLRRAVPGVSVGGIVRNHYEKAEISTPEDWLIHARRIEGWIDEIQARGGRVAVVRFPTSGAYWRYDQRYYPRAKYWDRFARESSALTLHFRDAPELRRFELPDRSHVNGSDARAFTRKLMERLRGLGLFERWEPSGDAGGFQRADQSA